MTTPVAQSMLYDANKKSAVVAYLLWIFLGVFGAHRFYAGKVITGIMQLALTALGWLLSFIFIGFIPWVVVGIWVLIDAFLIPGWIRSSNTKLAHSLTAGEQVG